MPNVKIKKGIFAVDLGVYLEEYSTLVLSDLHIGYEEAVRKSGTLLPSFHFKDLVKRIDGILKTLKSEKLPIFTIIINGDLKHEFGRISKEEWNDSLRLIDYLNRKCGKVVLILGNHDNILGPIADKRNISLVDNVLLGDILLVHGHKIVEIPSCVKTIIIGHEHPAVGITDEVRTETFKCYLKGKYDSRDLIVMPSMNPVVEGTNMLNEKTLSPYLNCDISKFSVFVVGDEVLEFGKIKDLL